MRKNKNLTKKNLKKEKKDARLLKKEQIAKTTKKVK